MYGWQTECEEGLVGAYYVGAGMDCCLCLADDQRGVLGVCAWRAGKALERVAGEPATLH